MVCGLSDMCLPDDVKTWLNAVDRGGLVHINHKLFYAIEIELRYHLITGSFSIPTSEIF